jgi:putative transposase
VDEFLSREQFASVASARLQTAAWQDDYNHHRPHSSLGYVTPAEFALTCEVRPGSAGTCGLSPALRPAAQSDLTNQPELS